MSPPLDTSGGDMNPCPHRCSLSPPLAPSGGDMDLLSPPLGGAEAATRLARVYISLYIQHAGARSPAPPGAHNACGVETRARHMPPSSPPHSGQSVLQTALGRGGRWVGSGWGRWVDAGGSGGMPREHHAAPTTLRWVSRSTLPCEHRGSQYGCTRLNNPLKQGGLRAPAEPWIQGSYRLSQLSHVSLTMSPAAPPTAPKGSLRRSPGFTPCGQGAAVHGSRGPKYPLFGPYYRWFGLIH